MAVGRSALRDGSAGVPAAVPSAARARHQPSRRLRRVRTQVTTSPPFLFVRVSLRLILPSNGTAPYTHTFTICTYHEFHSSVTIRERCICCHTNIFGVPQEWPNFYRTRQNPGITLQFFIFCSFKTIPSIPKSWLFKSKFVFLNFKCYFPKLKFCISLLYWFQRVIWLNIR